MVDLTESEQQPVIDTTAKSWLPDLKGQHLDILVLSDPGECKEGQYTLQMVKDDEPNPFAFITAMFEHNKAPMKGNTHNQSS